MISLAHESFKSEFLSFVIFMNFQNFLSCLFYSIVVGEHISCAFNIFKLTRCVLWIDSECILENIPDALEKIVYSVTTK